MKIVAKLFAVITIAFGINEVSKPIHEVDYDQEISIIENNIDSAIMDLNYIRKINDSLINEYFPIQDSSSI